jgi:nucleotide-binding universal stress UspA family protein
MYQRILVPVDGSACSDEAVRQAVAIARAMDSSIVFLHVMDTFRARKEGVVNLAEAREILNGPGQELVNGAQKTAADAGVLATGQLVEGFPVDEIVQRATDFDLVVMGSTGKGILKRLLVGSVTEGVLHRCARPVLIVR